MQDGLGARTSVLFWPQQYPRIACCSHAIHNLLQEHCHLRDEQCTLHAKQKRAVQRLDLKSLMWPTLLRWPHFGHAIVKLEALRIRACRSISSTQCTRLASSMIPGNVLEINCMHLQGGAALKDSLRGNTLCIPFFRLHKVFLVTLLRRVSKAELRAKACSTERTGKKTHTRDEGCKAQGLQPKLGNLRSFIQMINKIVSTLRNDTLGP